MDVSTILAQNDKQLSVNEFIVAAGYTIDQLYVNKFWDNISLFNSALNLPDIKELYPIRKETSNHHSIYRKELTQLYKPLIDKKESFPPIVVV